MSDIPWENCPYRLRFDEKVLHMEDVTSRMISEIGLKLDGVAELIRQEMRHQTELTTQNIQLVRQDITSVGSIARANAKRIEMLEAHQGRLAIAAWKWIAGVAAGLLSGGGLGWLITRLVQG